MDRAKQGAFVPLGLSSMRMVQWSQRLTSEGETRPWKANKKWEVDVAFGG